PGWAGRCPRSRRAAPAPSRPRARSRAPRRPSIPARARASSCAGRASNLLVRAPGRSAVLPLRVHDAGWASCRRGVPGSGWEPARRGYGAPRTRGRSPSPPSEADQAEGGLLSAPPELARVAARAEAERLDHRGGLREAVGECRGRVGVAAQADRTAALLGPPLRHPRPQAPGVHLERPAAGGDRAHRGAELLLEAPRVDGPPVLLGPVAQRVVEVGDDLE